MKNLDLKVEITICDPTSRDSKLVLERNHNVNLDTVDDIWFSICNEAEAYSIIFTEVHESSFIEFKFDILIDNGIIGLVLGRPANTPLPLVLYNEIKGLFTNVRLKLYD